MELLLDLGAGAGVAPKSSANIPVAATAGSNVLAASKLVTVVLLLLLFRVVGAVTGTGSDTEPLRSELQVTTQMRHFLLQTAKWTQFLAIVGFIFIGLMVIGAFTFGAIMSSLTANFPGAPTNVPGGSGAIMSIYLLFFAVLYFFPTLYLYQFSTKTKVALLYGEELNLAFAFSRLKSFFKFWGIFLIVILGLYGMVFIGYAIGSLAM